MRRPSHTHVWEKNIPGTGIGSVKSTEADASSVSSRARRAVWTTVKALAFTLIAKNNGGFWAQQWHDLTDLT